MAERNPKTRWTEFCGKGTAAECGWRTIEAQPLSAEARRLAALAIMHGDFPIADTEAATGRDFVELFRGFVK